MLLPVRDAAAVLGGCLDSLAAQTLADHEVVAVDDGSSDGSGELLAARAARDPRLRVLRTPPRGLPHALNLALAQARAGIVARMDADDLARPGRLLAQVARLEAEPGLDVLACRVATRALGGGRAAAGMRRYVGWLNRLATHEAMARARFVESPLAHPSVAMRTQALRALGYRDFDGPEDYDLWLRAFESGLRFGKLEAVLLDWRDSPGRLTRRSARYSAAAFRRLKIEALGRGPLAGRSAVVWGAGPLGKAFARGLVEGGQRVLAFVEVDPRKIGQRIHGAPVVPVPAAAGFGGALHLAAVGQPGARARIRAAAARLGLAEGADFFAVA